MSTKLCLGGWWLMINPWLLLEISLVWLCWASHVKYKYLPTYLSQNFAHTYNVFLSFIFSSYLIFGFFDRRYFSEYISYCLWRVIRNPIYPFFLLFQRQIKNNVDLNIVCTSKDTRYLEYWRNMFEKQQYDLKGSEGSFQPVIHGQKVYIHLCGDIDTPRGQDILKHPLMYVLMLLFRVPQISFRIVRYWYQRKPFRVKIARVSLFFMQEQ